MRIRLFWSAATTVERLRAIDHLAALDIGTVAHNGTEETQKLFRDELSRRMNLPVPPPPQTRSDKTEILALIQEI